jgi:hypothetical protein
MKQKPIVRQARDGTILVTNPHPHLDEHGRYRDSDSPASIIVAIVLAAVFLAAVVWVNWDNFRAGAPMNQSVANRQGR